MSRVLAPEDTTNSDSKVYVVCASTEEQHWYLLPFMALQQQLQACCKRLHAFKQCASHKLQPAL